MRTNAIGPNVTGSGFKDSGSKGPGSLGQRPLSRIPNRPAACPGRQSFGREARALVRAIAGAGALVAMASPAIAQFEPETRLVRCGAQTCLQISGYREDPAAIVSCNGHRLAVQGQNRWRVRLSVETVRDWSSPHARTIEVSLRNPQAEQQAEPQASALAALPIGLLGDVTRLASLEVRAP